MPLMMRGIIRGQTRTKETLGIDGWPSATGVAIRREIADEGEIEHAVEMPVAVVLRHGGFQGEEDGAVEIPRLRWSEHRATPFGMG
jgi:hypothetical protein